MLQLNPYKKKLHNSIMRYPGGKRKVVYKVRAPLMEVNPGSNEILKTVAVRYRNMCNTLLNAVRRCYDEYSCTDEVFDDS